MTELCGYDIADELRAEFGISVSELGCVMLRIEPLDLSAIPPEWGYWSPRADRTWINGIQYADDEQHVTLLYGLLRNANEIRPLVDRVLDGWKPRPVLVDRIVAWQSPFPDEDYKCVVGEVTNPNLLEAHERFAARISRVLPTHRGMLEPLGIDYGYRNQASAWERP